ncbi:MAG: glycosyltransferase family 9 protein [Phycisphaerales bacterium JB037]
MRPIRPLKLLVVCPNWVGDAVMATPTLRLLRRELRGSFIGALTRPGIDRVLDGAGFFDEVHVEPRSGMMGPKKAAAKVRPRHYEAALLLTNSFSTALTARLAGIPRRHGYDRDGRGLLLTDSIRPARTKSGDWAIVPAVDYYLALARAMLGASSEQTGEASRAAGLEPAPDPVLELGVRDEDDAAAAAVLEDLGVSGAFAMLVPGGSKEKKRWPADRFAAIARHLREDRGMAVAVSGSPDEAALVRAVAEGGGATALLDARVHLGVLKGIVRRAGLMVTNDTGPRHLAVALGVPVVALFGPTDHRWTIVPGRAPEVVVLADPTLEPTESANDHPERCAIDRISVERVREAVARALGER